MVIEGVFSPAHFRPVRDANEIGGSSGSGREERKRLRRVLKGRSLGKVQKKTARTVSCSCREASDANYFQLWSDLKRSAPSPEYLHDTIDRAYLKYKNLNFPAMRYFFSTQRWTPGKDGRVAWKSE
jgi:hypothetical protein